MMMSPDGVLNDEIIQKAFGKPMYYDRDGEVHYNIIFRGAQVASRQVIPTRRATEFRECCQEGRIRVISAVA